MIPDHLIGKKAPFGPNPSSGYNAPAGRGNGVVIKAPYWKNKGWHG